MKKYMRFFTNFHARAAKNQRGFTIVETLIVMGLMSIFMVVLTDIFAAILDIQNESSATSSVSQDGRFIMTRLNYDVNRATSISTPASLGASGSTLALVIGGVTNTYSIVGGNLQLVNGSGTNVLNGSDTTISALSVQRLGNAGGDDTVRLSWTITSKTATDKGVETDTFTTTIGRR